MSLLSNAQVAAQTDDPHQQTPASNDWYEQLVQLVPTEAIGVFTGAIAFCVGVNWGWTPRWICFGAVAVLSAIWVFVNYWDTLTTKDKHAKKFPMPYWPMGIGVMAFVIWSLTIPGTPFLQWHKWDLKFAPFVTLFGVVLLTLADRVRTIVKERRQPLPESAATQP
jgi:hypothetical protein